MSNQKMDALIAAMIDQTRAIDELVRVVDEQNMMLNQSSDEEIEKDYIEIRQMNGKVLRVPKK
ncbi:hypothetical protein [Salinicola sp. CPA57]|uniref:hypothetical protein n=1 Tax=Salinicola sp. CPA57 TaxID=1949080 RepID=UPI000DA15079|nr:hypothetical protein [Salinicola sp. CPA57]